MKIHPYREIIQAAKKNLFPGLLLQAVMIALLLAYFLHEPTRQMLHGVAIWKKDYGYAFSFLVMGLAAGLAPEILRVACFEKFRYRIAHLPYFIFGFFYWGAFGLLLDFFYRCQGMWLGNASDLRTVILKSCVDIFIFTPFIACPLASILYRWRDRGFRLSAFAETLCWKFVRHDIFPLVVACWAVWIPVIFVIYAMPSALQLPICVIAEVFWVLLLIAITEMQAIRDAENAAKNVTRTPAECFIK